MYACWRSQQHRLAKIMDEIQRAPRFTAQVIFQQVYRGFQREHEFNFIELI